MDEFNVEYRGKRYEISGFLKNHPGGINYLQGYRDKDITKRMKDIQHSELAHYLLREYLVGGREDKLNEEDDMENLIDWNRPLLSQLPRLGENYLEWVTSPVDRRIRIFKSDFLESLTITPWYVIPIMWIPIASYLIYDGFDGIKEIDKDSLPIVQTFYYIIGGFIGWSLVEYCGHRWIFHFNPGSYRALIVFHFLLHGLHHKAPFDSRRLVLPPVPSIIVVYIINLGISLFLSGPIKSIFMGGLILGYVTYDVTHYYIHYGSPSEGSYMYKLKRYHNHHHFTQHNSGFGVSSTHWDFLFGTLANLKKLAFGIRWS